MEKLIIEKNELELLRKVEKNEVDNYIFDKYGIDKTDITNIKVISENFNISIEIEFTKK
jgi:hypothetical protein